MVHALMKDGTGLDQRAYLRIVIDDCGNLAVRAQRQEGRRRLLVARDVDGKDAVGQLELFECDRHLAPFEVCQL